MEPINPFSNSQNRNLRSTLKFSALHESVLNSLQVEAPKLKKDAETYFGQKLEFDVFEKSKAASPKFAGNNAENNYDFLVIANQGPDSPALNYIKGFVKSMQLHFTGKTAQPTLTTYPVTPPQIQSPFKRLPEMPN